jgi:hypothetical protein
MHYKASVAGTGMRRIRISNLPHNCPKVVLNRALYKYGEVHEVREEMWTHKCWYKVSSGIRILLLHLKKHIPSHMNISFYAFNGTGHLIQHCRQSKWAPIPLSMKEIVVANGKEGTRGQPMPIRGPELPDDTRQLAQSMTG